MWVRFEAARKAALRKVGGETHKAKGGSTGQRGFLQSRCTWRRAVHQRSDVIATCAERAAHQCFGELSENGLCARTAAHQHSEDVRSTAWPRSMRHTAMPDLTKKCLTTRFIGVPRAMSDLTL